MSITNKADGLHVAVKPIGALVPYIRNARTHSDEQVANIAACITEFGWTNPILVDGENGVIAGHGRLLAARKLGMSEVPCIDILGLSDAQKRAYVIADNKLAMNAGWDSELLGIEIADLSSLDFDMELLGFSPDELTSLAAEPGTDGLTDPDDAPEVAEEAVTVLGDAWVLGRHRIVCGDCTDADTVALALNGVTPHLMVTDPPYGVEYDAGWRNDIKVSPDRAVGKVLNDDRCDWREAWGLFPGDVAYIWHADTKSPIVAESITVCGLELRALIVWAKFHYPMGRGHYHHKHEPCWYAVRKGGTGHWTGDRKQTTLWQIDSPRKSETGHSTQKPIECMKRPIENNSSPGQAVYEPFSGSGTTIIAAEMTGRACHAIELSPQYVDVAVKRWQEFTGNQAINEKTGEAFSDKCRTATV